MADLVLVRGPGVIARTEDRLRQVAEWMAQGMTPRKAAEKARDELRLSRRQADAYVSACLRRLASDGALEPIESKRARVVAMLSDSIEKAKAKKKQWFEESTGIRCDGCGKLAGEWVSQPDPDHKAIATLTASLVTVEGLASPAAQASVLAQQEVERLLGALQARLTSEQWAPVAAAVDAIRGAAAIVSQR